MLAKEHRLSKQAVTEVRKNGAVIHTSLFVVRFDNNGNHEWPEVSVVVSSRVCAKASDRALLKRRIHAILRITNIVNIKNARIVIAAKNTAKEASFQILTQDVQKLVQKMHKHDVFSI